MTFLDTSVCRYNLQSKNVIAIYKLVTYKAYVETKRHFASIHKYF